MSGVTRIDSTFKYDALGRRVYRKVIIYGPPATEEKEFTYIYDGFDLIQERVSRKLNGVTQPLAYNTYVHGPGVDEPLYMNKNVNGVSSDFYFHADALGSITSITNVNQVIAEFYSYTSFGEMTRTGGVFNKFLFTGRELDEETGLYYYRVRYLDPASGRFTSKDPIGFEGGVNKYVYVLNNPVNFRDPYGLFPSPTQIISDTINYWDEFFGGASDMYSTYKKMRQANRKEIGTDKYFHCKANCEASQRGPGGEDSACLISNTRELLDQKIHGYPAVDSAEDQVANRYGRSQGAISKETSCSEICAPYRPAALPPQY